MSDFFCGFYENYRMFLWKSDSFELKYRILLENRMENLLTEFSETNVTVSKDDEVNIQ